MSTTRVPAGPGLTGWFGATLVLVLLAAPETTRGPVLPVAVALAGCWAYGLSRHARVVEPIAHRRAR